MTHAPATTAAQHTCHIPVMGIAYTIDTPLKAGRYGIASVMTITEDHLLENMRQFYAEKFHRSYMPITAQEADARSRRVTAYLNLMQELLTEQMDELRQQAFNQNTDLDKCFQLLPPHASLRQLYERQAQLPDGPEKEMAQQQLRKSLAPGAMDVNIMTKCDKANYDENKQQLSPIYNDAMAALRGFAHSRVSASVVFSAGMNPRLYGYCEQFPDFMPDASGVLRKKIILKVSDYRSALIQGKFLAKKGLWVSEFRIESGLNCGGHAFATDGFLLGPALQEFKYKRAALRDTLWELYQAALTQKGLFCPDAPFPIRLSVQGGVGTAAEHQFLLRHYGCDSVGWGTPFLLVPEVTNVDHQTLADMVAARKEDFYLSDASPLGVPFHNFRNSSAQAERLQRIEKDRPGSPCYNKFLSFNTEFTEQPICTASRQYQALKIKQIQGMDIPAMQQAKMIQKVTEKECICQGLGTAAYLKNDIAAPHKLKAVSICPGPNMAWFKSTFSLRQMMRHIYEGSEGMIAPDRPHQFINEAVLYLDYLEKSIADFDGSDKQRKYLTTFADNLAEGLNYYRQLTEDMTEETGAAIAALQDHLGELEERLQSLNRLIIVKDPNESLQVADLATMACSP